MALEWQQKESQKSRTNNISEMQKRVKYNCKIINQIHTNFKLQFVSQKHIAQAS